MQHTIWQSILEYARIECDIACREAEKAINYNDVIGQHDKIWEGNKLIYHRDNTRTTHWNI